MLIIVLRLIFDAFDGEATTYVKKNEKYTIKDNTYLLKKQFFEVLAGFQI